MAFTEQSFAERTKAYEAWVARRSPIVRRGLALKRKLMAAATIAEWNKWRRPKRSPACAAKTALPLHDGHGANLPAVASRGNGTV